MEFDNAFEVPLPPEQAWPVLMDIPRIAPCMPGAQLTEVVDDRTYKGNIAVRLGPVALTFAGTVIFEEIDNANRTARVRAQGNDAKGRGSAQAAATFRLEPSATGSKVLVHTDLTLSGAVAQYGRGVGMIQATASALMNQFAKNLKKQLAEPSGSRRAPGRRQADFRHLACRAGRLDRHQGQVRREELRMAGSADNDPVILVDADDVELGTAAKLDAHKRGLRHRAISVLVRNSAGDFLLQRRNPGEVSFRRAVDERLLQPSAAGRAHGGRRAAPAVRGNGVRLRNRAAVRLQLQHARSRRVDRERGRARVRRQVHDGAIRPDPAEVSEWKWVPYGALTQDMRAHPDDYTIWFRLYVQRHGDMLADWIAAR
jgi:uncharacterized protein